MPAPESRRGRSRDAAAPSASPVAETIGVSKRFGASQALDDVSLVIPAGDSRALVGRNGAGKSTLVGRPDWPAGARCRPGPPRRRGRTRPRRPPELARAGRLRLSEVDRDSDPHGRREPVPERASDLRRRLGRLAGAAPAGGAGARGLGPRGRRRTRCRAPHGRAAPDRRDRARAPAGHPLHHPRRADRPARRPRGRPPVRADRSPAGGRRDLPLHLAPPRGDLRGLPQRDRAARRPGGCQRAARDDAQGARGRSHGRRCGAGRGRAEPPVAAADRGAGRLPRGARALHRGRSGGPELRGRGRRDRRAGRARGLGQGAGRRSDRRAGDAVVRARSESPARRSARGW